MVESLFHPIWHRHGPNMRGFSNQIDYGPVIFAALNVVKLKSISSLLHNPQPSNTASMASCLCR